MNRTPRVVAALTLFVGIAAVASSAGASPPPNTNGKIAFTRYDLIADRGSTFTIDPDGSHEAQIGVGEDVICPAWSPDGSKILVCDFLVGEGSRPATADPDGSDFTLLDAYPGLHQALTCLDWSPDGTRFICATDVGSGNPNPADNGLYTLRSSDGSDLERVTVTPEGYDDTNPVYSPDGSRILFSRLSDTAPSALIVVNTDGTDPLQLSPPGLSPLDTVFPADWSPDGSRVTFAAAWKSNGRGRGTALYVVNSDGSGLRQITPSGVGAVSAQWSPDGQLIAFTSKFRAQPQVWVVRSDGTGLREVTYPTNGNFSETPVWSPDGGKLLFLRGGNDQLGLWTVNLDGTGQSQVTTVAASAGYAWGTAPVG
jgi:Tol biopolymer transport system component